MPDDGPPPTARAARVGEGARDSGFARFEPGDVSTEHHGRNRWCSVKEVRAADGAPGGRHRGVTRPAGTTAPAAVAKGPAPDPRASADRLPVLRPGGDGFTASGLAERDPQHAAARAVAAPDAPEAPARRGGVPRGGRDRGERSRPRGPGGPPPGPEPPGSGVPEPGARRLAVPDVSRSARRTP